jgi:hypothetical protein
MSPSASICLNTFTGVGPSSVLYINTQCFTCPPLSAPIMLFKL